MSNSSSSCPLCAEPGGKLIWQGPEFRVVAVEDADYPGFCRVILNRHIAEMTDLPADQQYRLMAAVFAVEATLRAELAPHKINLASLGNQVPHLHWHVIPRYQDDRHFPNPIWSPPTRAASHPTAPDRLAALTIRLVNALNALGSPP